MINRLARRAGVACVAVAATAAVTTIAAVAAPAAATPTAQSVIRPVTTSGVPAPGYTIESTFRPLSCTTASSQSIDDGIATCGTSADGTLACWHAANPTHVLCLRDPYSKTVYRYGLDGTFPAARAGAHATPIALTLTSAHRYLARDGGAYAAPTDHPDWINYFHAYTGTQTIYGPTPGTGVDRSHRQWTTQVYGDLSQPSSTRAVGTAYFVGTSGATP